MNIKVINHLSQKVQGCTRLAETHSSHECVKQNGFTLIEILIVIVIISIVACFAVLSINIYQNKRLETLANQLKNTLNLAQQEALLRPTTLGFEIKKNSILFYEHHNNSESEQDPWEAATDSIFGLHHIPNDVQMTLKIKGKSVEDLHPQLILSGSDITPFTIYVGKKGNPPLYKIIGESDGNIKTEAINEN